MLIMYLSIPLHVSVTDGTELRCSNVTDGPLVTWLSRDHFAQFTGKLSQIHMPHSRDTVPGERETLKCDSP